MSELDYMTVKGFKSIASIEELELGPVTVLIGPNGSGKSNFIGVFAFLKALGEGQLKDYVIKAGGADKVLHFGSQVTSELYISVSLQKRRIQYEIFLEPTHDDQLIAETEVVHVQHKESGPRWDTEGIVNSGREAAISEQNSRGIVSPVRRRLDSWRLYHFHDTGVNSPMKKMADVNDNRYLRTDGSNLAAFLYLLRERHQDSYGIITGTVRQVVPFFQDFELEPQRLNPDKIRLEWRHTGTDAYFDAASLSDGTLRFMALATLFLQPQEYMPSVVLVDEPELGMHPYAITLLAALMKQASTGAQVIVSTQSSLLLDHFEPEEVLVAERVDGATQFTWLDSSKLESWLESYSLGQLWEKNELVGRPGPE